MSVINFTRPFAEVGGYFDKPRSVKAFLSELFYFRFNVDAAPEFASLNVCLFGFGFNVHFSMPLLLEVRLEAPCCAVDLNIGLRSDWEAKDLFREAEEKRARFLTAVNESRLSGITLDVADWNSEEALAERINVVKRNFRNDLWNTDSNEIPIGNNVTLVFKEDGVFADSTGH